MACAVGREFTRAMVAQRGHLVAYIAIVMVALVAYDSLQAVLDRLLTGLLGMLPRPLRTAGHALVGGVSFTFVAMAASFVLSVAFVAARTGLARGGAAARRPTPKAALDRLLGPFVHGRYSIAFEPQHDYRFESELVLHQGLWRTTAKLSAPRDRGSMREWEVFSCAVLREASHHLLLLHFRFRGSTEKGLEQPPQHGVLVLRFDEPVLVQASGRYIAMEQGWADALAPSAGRVVLTRRAWGVPLGWRRPGNSTSPG